MIKIVGLGPGSPDALTIGAVRALEESKIFILEQKNILQLII